MSLVFSTNKNVFLFKYYSLAVVFIALSTREGGVGIYIRWKPLRRPKADFGVYIFFNQYQSGKKWICMPVRLYIRSFVYLCVRLSGRLSVHSLVTLSACLSVWKHAPSHKNEDVGFEFGKNILGTWLQVGIQNNANGLKKTHTQLQHKLRTHPFSKARKNNFLLVTHKFLINFYFKRKITALEDSTTAV